MKVINLQIENFKRLKAIDITPDGFLQVIGGDNAQGKTSVMDALWITLGGIAQAKIITNPIREGETQASVRIDLGEIIVTRTWKGEKTTLKVESQNGSVFPSPQSMLDNLLGRLSFDPLEFTRLTSKQQVNALLDISGLGEDLDRLAGIRSLKYDQRADLGRQLKQLQAEVDALGSIEPNADEKISISDLVSEVQKAIAHNNLRSDLNNREDKARNRISELHEALIKAEKELDNVYAEKSKYPTPIDVDALQAKLDNAEQINSAYDRNQKRIKLSERLSEKQSLHSARELDIQEIDEEKERLVESAKFPVDGLGFDDEGVIFNGIPFVQASSAEQIKVSLGMAMALNPAIKVIRIMDGSLLDINSMQMVYEMAHEHDYQVWVERVGEGDSMAVIIEDGKVKE